jgi:TP901 family phage tail tape measure protein
MMAVNAQTLDDIYAAMEKLTKPLSTMLDDLKLFSKSVEEVQDKLAGATPAAKALKEALDKVGAGQEALSKAGSALSSAGGNVMGAVKAPLEAYAKAEDAVAGLKAQMSNAAGTPKTFEAVDALATRLGQTLPGTTADFEAMLATLMRNGASAQDVLGGLGSSTANLATALKMPAGEAASFALKLQQATQTGTKDMNGLADVVQRAFHAGVDQNDMLKAFSAMSPVLGQLKQQGLAGAQALTPLLVMANQAGVAGEAAGKAYQNMFASLQKTDKIKQAAASSGISLDFGDGAGGLANIDQIVAQFAKLKSLGGEKRESVLKSMFGDDKDTLTVVSAMIDKGVGGYTEVQMKMAAQADLQARVNQQAGTLKEMQANAGEGLDGLLSTLGSALAPQAKQLLGFITSLTTATNDWAKAHPELVQWIMQIISRIGILLGVFGGLLTGAAALLAPIMAVSSAISGFRTAATAFTAGLTVIRTAFTALSTFMMTNPIGATIAGIAIAATLLITFWEPIKTFFGAIFSYISNLFTKYPLLNFIFPFIGVVVQLMKAWEPLKEFFAGLFSALLDAIMPYLQPIVDFLVKWNPLSLISKGWEEANAYVAKLLDDLSKMVLAGINAVLGFLSGWSPLDAISAAWDAVSSFFSDLWNGISTDISNGVDAISGFFDGWSPLDSISAAWDAVTGFFSDLWDGVLTSAFDGVSAIGDFFSTWSPLDPIMSAWDAVTGFFSDLWSGISTSFSGGVSAIGDFFTSWSPLDLVTSAFTTVMTYLGTEMPAKFTEFGGMILGGLGNGITNGLSTVLQSIEGAGSGLVSRFKAILGIHSPSAVFAELGNFTMAGLDAGLQAAQDGPLGTILDMGDQLVSAGSAAIGRIGADMSPIQMGGLGMAGAGGGAMTGGSFVFNIYPSAGMDERALADLVAQKFGALTHSQDGARLGDED